MYAKLSIFALLTAGILLAPAQVRAQSHQSYTFTDLGAPPPYGASLGQAINNSGEVAGLIRPGGSVHSYNATVWQNNTPITLESLGGPRSEADAINNRGQAAGWAELPNSGGEAPTLWNGTKVTRLTTLGAGGEASAINNQGQVAGEVFLPQGGSGAVVWNGTQLTRLNSLGGTYSDAYAINNRGQVAGSSDLASPESHHAVLWNGKKATDLGTFGGHYSDAKGINDRGQVVGVASYGSTDQNPGELSHAALWNGARATDLGSLGGPSGYSFANGINNAGVIVGESGMADGSEHATLWAGGKITDLNDLLDPKAKSEGWVLFTANGINNEGWIVGSARNTVLQRTHAFLLTPLHQGATPMATPMMLTVPEPETYAMFLAGLGLIAGTFLRRRKSA